MKSEKVVICGQTGSGKDYLLRGLIKKGLKYKPKITTRPKRKLEREGIEYNFINDKEFTYLIESNSIKVYQKILVNDVNIPENILEWYYGISNENFNINQVFIMTPHEISTLSESDRKKCFIVYLDIDEHIRKERIMRRNDSNDSVDRRLKSDKIDFKDFKIYDLGITDPEFDADIVYSLMN